MFQSNRASTILAFAAASVLLLTGAPSAIAQEAKGKNDEKAMAVLKGMSDYLAGAPSVSVGARKFYVVFQVSGI